jgi:hypothetical protein
MNTDEKRAAALEALLNINRIWLDGRVEALEQFVHPDVVMIFPDFTGRVTGREDFLAGFRDFCANARIDSFHDHSYATDLIGDTAVITFQYEMTYERSGERYRATGRDLWVLREMAGNWLAVWRAMLDLHEQPT